ncbi:GDSL-like Lipase/Acylhydrolase [Astrocystis sublimbata]|nr:GDSL-like Lipase/Acylhydrolase [Astrocystis sublimbata]
MHTPTPLTLLATAQMASAATVFLAGDSTMARAGGGSGTEGWGEFLQASLPSADFTIANRAIGGRSARSYTREGRFQGIADEVKEGDWVVVEFGHNDGGSLANDNGRSDCFGEGEETCDTVFGGVKETVLTYPAYYKSAAKLFLDKGAKVILSSATPNNICEGGPCVWGPSRFDYYAWLAASQLGGPEAGVFHVPHGEYAGQAMMALGSETVNAHYPNDHTHTDAFLANVMAGSFVLGLKCGTSELGAAVTNSTESLAEPFGDCIEFNSTVPVKY